MSEQGQQTTTQPAKPNALDKIAGTFESAAAINERLRWAVDHGHLVSPVTAVTRLPEGVGVALSFELLDVERDTYGLPGGKRAILKPALERIGRAAGVKWNARECYTRKVGLHHYESRAVGYVLDLSFQHSPIVGEVDMDYGPGSIGEEKVRADAKDKTSAEKTLREIRHFLSRHAESRAYLRAIRRLGVATSYTVEQLRKPFVALQLTWTGRSNDLETQRAFSKMTAERMLGASSALYGGSPPAHVDRLPEVTTAPAPRIDATPRPLPETTRADVLDYDLDTGEVRDPMPAQRQQAAPAQQQRREAPPASQSSGATKGDGQPSRSGAVVRFGRNKDKALADLSLDDLAFYRGKIEEGANDPEKDRFRADALRHLDEIDRAISAARGEDEPPADDDRTVGSPDDY